MKAFGRKEMNDLLSLQWICYMQRKGKRTIGNDSKLGEMINRQQIIDVTQSVTFLFISFLVNSRIDNSGEKVQPLTFGVLSLPAK